MDQAAFSYLGEARKEKDLRWNDNWKNAAISKTCRIRVSFRSGDTRTWPELLIAPRVRAESVACTTRSPCGARDAEGGAMPVISVLWGLGLLTAVALSLLWNGTMAYSLTHNDLESAQITAALEAGVNRAVAGSA